MSTSGQIGELKSNVPGGVGPVKIRSAASTDADYVSKPIGTRVTLLGLDLRDAAGFTWYQVSYDGSKVGWVREDVIKILPASPSPSPTPTPPTDANTRLYFETNTRKVRIFTDGSNVFMNVYNIRSGKTEVNRVPARKSAKDAYGWTAYSAVQDGRAYEAKFIPFGETQLRIASSSSDLNIEPTESGFKQSGTDYTTR